MKFADHLSRKTIRKFNQIKSSLEKPMQPDPSPKKPEQLSRKDIEELMGTRRDTYSRVRGAMRRK